MRVGTRHVSLLMIGLRATTIFRSTFYEFLMTSFIAPIREKRGRGVASVPRFMVLLA